MASVALWITMMLVMTSACVAFLLRMTSSADPPAMRLERPQKGRVPWLVLAEVLMFGSAYFALACMDSGFRIGDWTGLPQYADAIQRLEHLVWWWLRLAIVLPFAAAFVMGIGPKTPPKLAVGTRLLDRGWWDLSSARYLVRLVVSVAGTLIALVAMVLVDILCYKLRVSVGLGWLVLLAASIVPCYKLRIPSGW